MWSRLWGDTDLAAATQNTILGQVLPASAKIDLACNLRYAAGLGRALLGAMIFALPLMMTMEMWEFGVTIEPLRQATTLLLSLPMQGCGERSMRLSVRRCHRVSVQTR